MQRTQLLTNFSACDNFEGTVFYFINIQIAILTIHIGYMPK